MGRKDAKDKEREKSPRKTKNAEPEGGGGGGVAVAEEGGGAAVEQQEHGGEAAFQARKFNVGDYVRVTSADPEDAKYLGKKAKVVELDNLGGVIIRGEWDGELWEQGGEELVFDEDLLARWEEPAAVVNDAIDTAVAAAAETSAVLSESDRRFLARRNAVEAAMKNVDAAKEDMGAAIVRHEEAKKHLKSTEAALEAAWDRLYRAERNEPDPQQGTLFEAPAETTTSSNGEADADLAERQKAWDAKWEAFTAQSIDALDLSDFLREKLAGEDIATLKDLALFKANSGGQGYTLIDGVGTEKADKIDDAYENLMQKFLAENPQPKKADSPAATAADETPEADPGSYDFVDTFPTPVNATPNETYDADYHRAAIRDAKQELEELRTCKDCLSRGVNESGKLLTDRSRKSLETKIGELQMQYDEGFGLYAEKFGKIAGDAMRRHVEDTVDKKAALKGGLE